MAVKKDKDRRILALRGQRQSLEVQLTDLEARSQANAAKQHIKLLDEVRPESRVTASSPSPSACGVTAQRASEAPAGLRLEAGARLSREPNCRGIRIARRRVYRIGEGLGDRVSHGVSY